MSKVEATKVVYEFLLNRNRPYAINDILKECSPPTCIQLDKSLVQQALDKLVGDEKIVVKAFGNIRIYYAKQEAAEVAEFNQQLRQAKQQLTQAQNQLSQKQQTHRELMQQLRGVKPTRSIESLDDERNDLFDAIREMNEKLRQHEAKAKGANISADDVKGIENRYADATTAYRKRKRICTDMLDAIMEGYPKSKKALIEDIGLETDEDAGYNVTLMKR